MEVRRFPDKEQLVWAAPSKDDFLLVPASPPNFIRFLFPFLLLSSMHPGARADTPPKYSLGQVDRDLLRST